MWFKKPDQDIDDVKVDDAKKVIISGMWDTLKRYDAYIATVNFKCGLLTSFNAAIAFSILSKFDAIMKSQHDYKSLMVLLCIASLFLCITSLYYVFKSIWPNLSSGSTSAGSEPSVIFFGSVSGKFNADTYSRKMESISCQDYIKDLSIQVHEMAVITSVKMASIERAGKFSKYNLFPITLIMLVWIFNISGGICLA
ncbi:Pycsar system effector family protein [Aeromonas hydrophila]|uniref:Pycsar system effector family protein n=1 Tax=Aeromonas hydrophila TaxID=644 RepID=UPI002360931B|nr:Pycsar system effector family protein [Aeromonas hydrophila]